MDQRCGYRRPAQLKVLIRTSSGSVVEGEVLDISASGALVAGVAREAVCGSVLLQFVKGGSPVLACAVKAAVVREAQCGFAVEWEQFSPPAIRSMLRQLALPPDGDPERGPRPSL